MHNTHKNIQQKSLWLFFSQALFSSNINSFNFVSFSLCVCFFSLFFFFALYSVQINLSERKRREDVTS